MSACPKTRSPLGTQAPGAASSALRDAADPLCMLGASGICQKREEKAKRPSFLPSPTDLSSRRLVSFPGLVGDLQLLHLLKPSRSAGAREEQREPNCCHCSQALWAKPPLGLHPELGLFGYICQKGAKSSRAMWVKIPLVMWFRPEGHLLMELMRTVWSNGKVFSAVVSW